VIGAHNFAPPLSDIHPILDGFIADCFEWIHDSTKAN
jgi:hypothetical protein